MTLGRMGQPPFNNWTVVFLRFSLLFYRKVSVELLMR